jgi:hypothetical protein
MKGAEFDCLETRRLSQDPLENTFGAICLHCGSSNNPTVSGLAFRDVCGTNFEDDDASLLNNLHSFLRGGYCFSI